MGEACCVGEPNAEYLLRIADFGLRILPASRRRPGRASERVPPMRNPQSTLRNAYRMNFPDRLPIPDEVLKVAQTPESAVYDAWCVGAAVPDHPLGAAMPD